MQKGTMNHSFRRTPLAHALALPLVLALSACGGGGSSSSVDVSTPAALKLTGTAAVGAPMANAAITIACATGSATLSADANGVYTVTITDGALPCAITATSSDGLTELHAIAAGSGSADTTANITPLTELLVAQLSGGDPKAFVTGFSSTTMIDPAAVAAAQVALLQTLAAAGVDTAGIDDILGGAIAAGSGTGYDGVLDKLKVVLDGAGSTLADLTTAVSTTSGAGSDTSSSTVTTILARAAGDCPGLRSGTLRVLGLGTGESSLVQVDAAALTASSQGVVYTMTRNADCDYTIADGDATRVLVARSGVAVLLTGSGATGVAGVAIPEQKLDVAALAGSYDRVQYGATFDSEVGDFGTTVFAADGQNGLSVNCPLGVGNCADDPQSKGKLVANADGGFDYMENGASQARVFAFRNAAGRNLLIAQAADGTVTVLAGKVALELPVVGKVSPYWQFTINAAGLGAVAADANTVTAVDTAAGTVTRQFADSHFDTLAFNAPFDGTRYRATNACMSSTGAALACNGTVQVAFGGIVVGVSAVPAKHFVSVSIDKP